MPTANERTGKKAVLVSDLVMRILHQVGVDRIYGSPGTTELSLVQSAARCGITYHFALHDTVAVGMADGFARASQRVAVANLHSTQGPLNASGFIRVALRDNVPLLVVAGVPSTTYDIYEPNHFVLGLDRSLTPITKWGWTVSNVGTLAQVLNRALSVSLAPPQGPTFVCIPQDILEREIDDPLEKISQGNPPVLDAQSVPTGESIERAARLLARAETPTLFVGYGAQDAVQWVEALSDLIGAPVVAEALDRGPQVHNVYCRASHPLFMGFFDVRDQKIKERLAQSDLLLFVGAKTTYAKVIGELPRACTVIQLSDAPDQIGKCHRVDVPLVGDVGATLKGICSRLEVELEQGTPASALSSRKNSLLADIAAQRRQRDAEMAAVTMRGSPIQGMQLIKALRESLPPDAVIVDDSQGMGYYLKHYYNFEARTLYGSMASHIGWALPASLGVKQARPADPVVCLVGDGSFMFSFQALAAAATYAIPVLVIVANNRGYLSLQKEVAIKWELTPELKRTLSLNQPAFDYAALAKSMGLEGIKVLEAFDLSRAIQSGLETVTRERQACVIDVTMSAEWKDWGESWYVARPRQIPK